MWEIKSTKSKETRQIWNKLKDKMKTKEQRFGLHELLYKIWVESGVHEGVSIPCLQKETKYKHTTLNWKLKLELHEPYKKQSEFRCSGWVSTPAPLLATVVLFSRQTQCIVIIDVSHNWYRNEFVFTTVGRYPLSFVICMDISYRSNKSWWRPKNFLSNDSNLSLRNPWFSSFIISCNPLSIKSW